MKRKNRSAWVELGSAVFPFFCVFFLRFFCILKHSAFILYSVRNKTHQSEGRHPANYCCQKNKPRVLLMRDIFFRFISSQFAWINSNKIRNLPSCIYIPSCICICIFMQMQINRACSKFSDFFENFISWKLPRVLLMRVIWFLFLLFSLGSTQIRYGTCPAYIYIYNVLHYYVYIYWNIFLCWDKFV